MSIGMDRVLTAKLGEDNNVLRAAFKKTVYIKKYETEVTELESVVNLGHPISDEERARKLAILAAQIEYAAFVSLLYKGQVSAQEFAARKEALENTVTTVLQSPAGERITMERILATSFNEQGGRLRSTFKKTVSVREFETEVVEMENTLDVPSSVTGAERALISAILRAQVEYAGYRNMCDKGFVTADEMVARVRSIESEITSLKAKAEAVTGQSMDKYF